MDCTANMYEIHICRRGCVLHDTCRYINKKSHPSPYLVTVSNRRGFTAVLAKYADSAQTALLYKGCLYFTQVITGAMFASSQTSYTSRSLSYRIAVQ